MVLIVCCCKLSYLILQQTADLVFIVTGKEAKGTTWVVYAKIAAILCITEIVATRGNILGIMGGVLYLV